jgi:F-type H+-transporting ATPase subunit gamma
VLRDPPREPPTAPREQLPIVAIVFGTDQGMCGQFNDSIVSHAIKRLTLLTSGNDARARRWAVGSRAAALLSDTGDQIESVYAAPASLSHVTSLVQQLALDLGSRGTKSGPYELWLFHHLVRTGAGYGPVDRRVLPADRSWLNELGHRRWSTSQLPMCGGDRHTLYSALVQQYLFLSLHQAMLESMLSENVARFSAMQAAERNIEDVCASLRCDYQQSRQSAITGELLEIVSGFEAMTRPAAPASSL